MSHYSYEDVDKASYSDETLAIQSAFDSYIFAMKNQAHELAIEASALSDGNYDRREILAKIAFHVKQIESIAGLADHFEGRLKARGIDIGWSHGTDA